jgi:hypothetical protein
MDSLRRVYITALHCGCGFNAQDLQAVPALFSPVRRERLTLQPKPRRDLREFPGIPAKAASDR